MTHWLHSKIEHMTNLKIDYQGLKVETKHQEIEFHNNQWTTNIE
jgi:hypothetical protein